MTAIGQQTSASMLFVYLSETTACSYPWTDVVDGKSPWKENSLIPRWIGEGLTLGGRASRLSLTSWIRVNPRYSAVNNGVVESDAVDLFRETLDLIIVYGYIPICTCGHRVAASTFPSSTWMLTRIRTPHAPRYIQGAPLRLPKPLSDQFPVCVLVFPLYMHPVWTHPKSNANVP